MDRHAEEFKRRAARIDAHGLGLSVDLYTPDLEQLLEALRARGLDFGYLEIFKGAHAALAALRGRIPDVMLTYHGEGIWVTQPDMAEAYPIEVELAVAASHLRALHSAWINHECATKQMAGYSFGTYLPPLYTERSADVTAENIGAVQRYLDIHANSEEGKGTGPLFLLEMPPLTYFACGSISIPAYFQRITEQVACGLVLDIGHLWTVYRYSGAWRRGSLMQFVEEFLEGFPLERVVEIHMAGLAVHEQDGKPGHATPPRWIDAHAAPIPAVLFELLTQVLANPRLCDLKGIALEVDTKPIPQILVEFEEFRQKFSPIFCKREQTAPRAGIRDGSQGGTSVSRSVREDHRQEYELYAKVVIGQSEPGAMTWNQFEFEEGERYRQRYLPHEILHWGGELRHMFPQTCRLFDQQGVQLSTFVQFWFRRPYAVTAPYDFFLMKIERFIEFAETVYPASREMVMSEAAELRAAYDSANEPAGTTSEVRT